MSTSSVQAPRMIGLTAMGRQNGDLPTVGQAPLAPATRFSVVTTLISWVLCSLLLVFFIVDSRRSGSGGCQHWFILPVFICGVIIAHDMIDWFRGRFDVFDPVGLLGIFGFHWFFVAPLLQVDRDWWVIEKALRPTEPRDWLGWMSVLNLVGLLIYRYLRNPLTGNPRAKSRRVWIPQEWKFTALVPFVLIAALGMQIYFYAIRGGISGFLQAYSTGSLVQENDIALVAMV